MKRFEKKSIRIKPDDAILMANKICARMQKEFEDIILENFPIKETVERVTKDERNMEVTGSFDTKDRSADTKKMKVIKKSKVTIENQEKI